jgi:hypothetical protein
MTTRLVSSANITNQLRRTWRHFRLAAFLAVLLAGGSFFTEAEVAVIPKDRENTPGPAAGVQFQGSGYRFQAIYNAQEFLPLMPNGAEITEIAFRLDESIRTPVNAAIADIEIHMSTSPSTTPVFPHPFDRRVGLDDMIVFSRGRIDVSAQPSSGGPNPFSIIVPLTRSFSYRPEQGDLVVDFFIYEGSGSIAVDADEAGGTGWSAFLDRPTSESAKVLGVMRLNYTAIPEPRAIAVGFIGVLVFLLRRLK